MIGVTGYVLAGGRSSRMGRDKAMLDLFGHTMIERAVERLRGVADRVCIVGRRPEFAGMAEVVPDLREGCGPLAGVEAALEDMRTEWALLMAVDMPFVPRGLLLWMCEGAVARAETRAVLFSVEGRPQPALALLHKGVLPSIRDALDRSELRMFPALREAANRLAKGRGVAEDEVLWMPEMEESIRAFVTEAQWRGRRHWFENLNTPEDLTASFTHAELLDD